MIVHDGDSPQTMLDLIKRLDGNDFCADCGQSKPEWAIMNFGALVCIDCSGVHRSLGVHVSRVRSLGLDKWEPELADIMLALGNSLVNSVLEATPGMPKPKPGASRFGLRGLSEFSSRSDSLVGLVWKLGFRSNTVIGK